MILVMVTPSRTLELTVYTTYLAWCVLGYTVEAYMIIDELSDEFVVCISSLAFVCLALRYGDLVPLC